MKKFLTVCILSVLLSCCAGCAKKGMGVETTEETGGSQPESTTQAESTTQIETIETAKTEQADTESENVTTTQSYTEDDEYIYVGDGMMLKKIEGYTYKRLVENRTYFSVYHEERDGFISMDEEWLEFQQPYREIKKAKNMYYWRYAMADGVLEEYIELPEGMGLSIYLYETRQPYGQSEFETFVPEYGYRAFYGMDGSRMYYHILFPVSMALDEVKEFCSSIQIEPEFFANQEKRYVGHSAKLREYEDGRDRFGYKDGSIVVEELDGYDYIYVKNRSLIPFRAVKRDGAGTEFEMVRETLPAFKWYGDIKEAQDLEEWNLGATGTMCGPLVSFEAFENGVNLSLYQYSSRGDMTETYYNESFPEYSYIALYGAKGKQYVYAVFFPKDMTLEEVEIFLDSIQVGAELFDEPRKAD